MSRERVDASSSDDPATTQVRKRPEIEIIGDESDDVVSSARPNETSTVDLPPVASEGERAGESDGERRRIADRRAAAGSSPSGADDSAASTESGRIVEAVSEDPTASGDGASAPGTLDQARALLAAADPAATYRALAGLARNTHGSLLVPQAFDASLPIHQPTCVVVEPEPASRETMQLYARAAYPDFDSHLLAPMSDPRLDHLLNQLHQMLVHDGLNVALVTNHGQIIDIALVLAALVMAQTSDDRRYGVLGEVDALADVVRRSNLLLSRMVTTRQVFNIPTPEVLEVLCRCFYSVPQTHSRRRAKLDSDLARANNIVMRHELEATLDRGGQLLAMAASGSQDLRLAAGLVRKVRSSWRARRGEDPGDAPSLHLQPLYNGTIQLMLTCRYVMPVALSLDRAHPACEVGAITRVKDADDCHAVMDWIAAAHERATGVATVYHHREDDLLTQVRDVMRS